MSGEFGIAMKFYIHEITDLESEFDFSQEDPWVRAAVARSDEKPDDIMNDGTTPLRPGLPKLDKRSIAVHFSLRKVDDVVVVNGSIDTSVHLICSRCVAPFDFRCDPSFSALFCKDPATAGVAHLDRSKPMGQNQGFARHAHDFSNSDNKDLDITYLSGDTIDLADILNEQIQLQIPFQPLCKVDCKGICSNCGTDFNLGRCACAKQAEVHPFSALKALKL